MAVQPADVRQLLTVCPTDVECLEPPPNFALKLSRPGFGPAAEPRTILPA